MNIDAILESFERHEVEAILIGGMNFLLRHQPVLTSNPLPEESPGTLMNPSLHDLKARDEAKRDRMYDPVQRWKHLQETITWAEANNQLAFYCAAHKKLQEHQVWQEGVHPQEIGAELFFETWK